MDERKRLRYFFIVTLFYLTKIGISRQWVGRRKPPEFLVNTVFHEHDLLENRNDGLVE